MQLQCADGFRQLSAVLAWMITRQIVKCTFLRKSAMVKCTREKSASGIKWNATKLTLQILNLLLKSPTPSVDMLTITLAEAVLAADPLVRALEKVPLELGATLQLRATLHQIVTAKPT